MTFQIGHPVYGGFETRFKKGHKSPKPWKKGHKPWNTSLPSDKQPFTGKKHSEETKRKMRKSALKRKHPLYKGENAGYAALHYWVVNRKGKARKCLDCKTVKGKIEWSNIDHKYNRKLEDYQPRCVPCHRKYDKMVQNLNNVKGVTK